MNYDVKVVREVLCDIPEEAIAFAGELMVAPSVIKIMKRILDQHEAMEKALEIIMYVDSYGEAYRAARKTLQKVRGE